MNTISTLAALLVLLLVISSIEAETKQQHRNTNERPGACPSTNSSLHIHCRRRVCLESELKSGCQSDDACPGAKKCCRPMCSCKKDCVEAV
ncbi:unnamed protein product [Adineta steineri]|uniref:WAP domain-containing protein n=1 Tax=Adineta steineri TaxID=433720 RepID=A0A815QYB8_9BILA|nr:unnamed protein product [Adineta steineri]CAF4111198.1 unnamed protein product [Adineta steineri]